MVKRDWKEIEYTCTGTGMFYMFLPIFTQVFRSDICQSFAYKISA